MDEKIYTADDAMEIWHKCTHIHVDGQNLIDIDFEFSNRGDAEYDKWIDYYSKLLSDGIIESDVQLAWHAIII